MHVLARLAERAASVAQLRFAVGSKRGRVALQRPCVRLAAGPNPPAHRMLASVAPKSQPAQSSEFDPIPMEGGEQLRVLATRPIDTN